MVGAVPELYVMITEQVLVSNNDYVGVYDDIDNGVGCSGYESKVSLVSGKCLMTMTLILVVSAPMMLIIVTMMQGVGATGQESLMSLVTHPLMSLTHNEDMCAAAGAVLLLTN